MRKTKLLRKKRPTNQEATQQESQSDAGDDLEVPHKHLDEVDDIQVHVALAD